MSVYELIKEISRLKWERDLCEEELDRVIEENMRLRQLLGNA